MEQNISAARITLIKNIYFYLVSFVALMVVVFSIANIINITLKTYVFTKADYSYYPAITPGCDPMVVDESVKKLSSEECAKLKAETDQKQQDELIGQRQRELIQGISFLIVGIPLFCLHWMQLRKDK